MNTTTDRNTSFLRSWARAVALGAVLALAFGAVLAWRNPDRPFWLQLAVFTATSWPILTIGLQMLWFDREATDAEIDRESESIEHAWHREAGQTAFYTLIGGLIAMETLGDVAHISWLSPIGLVHVLVLGLVTYAASYLYLRRKNS